MSFDHSAVGSLLPAALNDSGRLLSLSSYNLLDSDEDETFNSIARLAATLAKVANVGISLVDSSTIWFKASTEATHLRFRVSDGFCGEVVKGAAPLFVPDATLDPLFSSRAAVTHAGFKFYAGVPLFSAEGYAIGALCAWENSPREDGIKVLAVLEQFAVQVQALLSLSRKNAELEQDHLMGAVTNEVLELVLRDAPLERTLELVASAVSKGSSGVLCSIFLREGETFRPAVAPTSAGEGVLSEGFAACAMIALEGDIVDIPDLSSSAPRAASCVARLIGARTCSTVPIVGETGEVIGAFVVHSRKLGDTALNIPELERWLRLAALAIQRTFSQDDLRYLATHDALTGLPDRAAVLVEADRTLTADTRTAGSAVFIVALDRFKLLNDSFGHQVGDLYLKEMSKRLCDTVRMGDVVGRLGGDIFVVFCPVVSGRSTAETLAARIVEVASQPIRVQGHEVVLSASVGVAIASPAEQLSATDLVRFADSAASRAKVKGRARFEVSEGLGGDTHVSRLVLEGELRAALNAGELYCVYQPKVDLRTGDVAGLETLVRWVSPTRGFIPPSDFIPVAEEAGLITKLGEMVLRSACAQLAAWRASDTAWQKVVMWVNVSGHQLNSNLPPLISTLLEEYDIPGDRLGVEITESTLMDDFDAARRIVEELKTFGIKVAIDDFGTGFSSLAQLKHFPVDVLKIDRSFVIGLGQDQADNSIAAAVIGLARALNLKVVAEGVETDAQRDELMRLGCDMAQGYLYARPEKPEDVAFVKVSSWLSPAGVLRTK